MDRRGAWPEVEEVLTHYPLLRAEQSGFEIKILGTFTILGEGAEVDRFQIEIVLPADYPANLPQVWETGGRVPRTADRHVYPSNGQACTMLVEQRWELWPRGSTLLMYVNGPMRNYFISQALVENGDPWPWGEWAHDLEGVVQYYQALLKAPTYAKALPLLQAAGTPQLKGYNDCPCGSKKRTWHCHGDVLKGVRSRMGVENAAQAHRDLAARIEKLQAEHPQRD